ncbi:ABC transporter ATP-binding protein [Camelliibacillus cellulosilyticus]|uniref:ABC transporter ATP-binding protein n=1 Tax=Camelliibacillus cellulosilyticus TaxID=2174486 RepID=A0ABV9GLJ7_9BACL
MSESSQNKRPGRRGHGGPHHMAMMPGEKAKDFKGSLRRLIGYLTPHKYALIAVFVAAILSTVFTIWAPKIMAKAVDALFNGIMGKMKGIPGAHIDFHYILQIILILAGLYLISALFMYVQQYIMVGISQKIVYQLRRQVNAKLGTLPLKFFDNHAHGDILSRVVNDVDNISNTLQQSLTMIVTSVVTLIGVLVMMFWISPLMTIILLLTLPLSFVVIKMITKRSQRYFVAQQKHLGDLNGHVEEMYTGHAVVKAYNREKRSVEQFEVMNEKLYESGWKAQFISGIVMPLMMFIGNIGYVLICVVGGLLVMHRAITVGDIQAFIQYARQFSQPINQVASIANIIQSTIASAERVFELLDEEEEIPDSEQPVALMQPKGAVRFDHVAFGYKQDEPLMRDLTIDVKQGQTIAIVGPTGAGKTTLVNLLMRFYEVDRGKITIDGVDLTDMKRGDLRTLFGMVLQDTWLFNGTIRDNIAYGREGATDEEVVRAAQAAQADHFIRTLPYGYDTVLNEEATNISQGQKQLITIARAILADPAILILDEATSSVDTRTEVAIQLAMNHIMQGRTNFVIAHRLSTIRGADRILVMNHGDVVEQGTHEELLEKGGFYADLYNSQFVNQRGA